MGTLLASRVPIHLAFSGGCASRIHGMRVV